MMKRRQAHKTLVYSVILVLYVGAVLDAQKYNILKLIILLSGASFHVKALFI